MRGGIGRAVLIRPEEEMLESLKGPLSNILLLEGETLIERSIESDRYEQITEDIKTLRNNLDL